MHHFSDIKPYQNKEDSSSETSQEEDELTKKKHKGSYLVERLRMPSSHYTIIFIT